MLAVLILTIVEEAIGDLQAVIGNLRVATGEVAGGLHHQVGTQEIMTQKEDRYLD